jgi:hypothetical protein
MVDTPTSQNIIREESEKSGLVVKRKLRDAGDRIPIKRFAGDQCMNQIGSEDEGESSSRSRSRKSKSRQSKLDFD